MLKKIQDLALSSTQAWGHIPKRLETELSSKALLVQYFNLWPNPKSNWKAQRAIVIDVAMTLLSGSIPRSFGKLLKLQHDLRLWNNSLVGAIPDYFGNFTELTYLDISSTIPVDIVNCTELTHLYLDHNKFSGEIPVSPLAI
ncbi:hypothetical protein Pint_03734 [Pistacia integerrima]|uniref:Uncharacterized protein n=1 Tax=Pistacia integerrima TaxID=434235 RepID=A0ACC0Z256_9ROSI|nr:hypothetical protein Pint_03734 [Pistacia integerrima]